MKVYYQWESVQQLTLGSFGLARKGRKCLLRWPYEIFIGVIRLEKEYWVKIIWGIEWVLMMIRRSEVRRKKTSSC